MNDGTGISISNAESQVMEVLWHASMPVPAEHVVAALFDMRQWQATTVKTMLNRLLNKGAVAAERDGRRFLYRAILQRETWLASESEGLLQRLFGGRIAPMVAHFGSRKKLSAADLRELRDVLDQLEEEHTAS